MKANLLLLVLAIGTLAGCTAAEQDKTLTSEKTAIDRAQRDTEVTAAKTSKELQKLKDSTLTGVQTLREGAKKGAAALTKETASGAQAVEQGAKGLEQFSHDAATRAAAVSDAVKKFDGDNKSITTSPPTAPAKSAH